MNNVFNTNSSATEQSVTQLMSKAISNGEFINASYTRKFSWIIIEAYNKLWKSIEFKIQCSLINSVELFGKSNSIVYACQIVYRAYC